MAFDSARSRVVLFGGDGNGLLADTWEWDGVNWLQRLPTTSPSSRRRHSMAYDAARQRIILFGGWNGSNAMNDTWEWGGTNWIQRSPTTIPAARHYHVMSYDSARQRIVLFGGNTGAAFLGDTWEWDGTTWLARFSTAYPSARMDSGIAYDSARQKTVLFGGWNAGDLTDTWEWDGTNWAPRTPSGLPVRRHGAMAYDALQQRVTHFGGYLGDGSCCNSSNATWGSTNAGSVEFGSGCGTPPLLLQRESAMRPLLGVVGVARVSNAPTQIAGVAMGFSNQFYGPFALPVPLDSIGMSGCQLWHSADVLALPLAPGSAPLSLDFAYAIPTQPQLLGARVYLQAYVVAPGANSLQIISSNAIEWRLGAF